jgi:hypothetical protein
MDIDPSSPAAGAAAGDPSPHERRHPIRLVVTDDLERRRVTVFARLLLAIPHLIVVSLWGLATIPVSFVLWVALLIEGRAPKSLQGFVAAYVRYAAQVGGYLYLAASPWPSFGGADGYPLDVEVDVAREQSRWRVATRLFLAVPPLMLAATLGGGLWVSGFGWTSGPTGESGSRWSAAATWGGVTTTAVLLAWFAVMVRGRMPRGLRDVIAYAVGYSAQVTAYLGLVTDVYPDSNPQRMIPDAKLPAHPVRIDVRDELHRSRLTVFFRLLLALPHLVWLALWTTLALLAVLVAWAVALAIGRVPLALHRFLAAYLRYATHLGAFLCLVGGPFPGFVGAAGSYPIDLLIESPAPQRRAVTLFRLLLAIPAFMLAGAYTGVLWIVAVLGWWYALFTGRMPEGIRNLGAAALRYSGQANAYVFLLTERYPYSSPLLRERPRPEQLELPLTGPFPELPPDPAGGAEGVEPA